MEKRIKRQIFIAKDVRIITGKSMKTCYLIMRKIKKKFKKTKGQLISLHEAALYFGWKVEHLMEMLGNALYS